MLAERLDAEELMDDPALPAATYATVLQDLARVNRATLAYRPTLAFLDRALAGHKSFRLLDVGFGQGDMLRRIARWADRRGKQAELVGVDLNPRSEVVARFFTPVELPIRYRTGDYAELAGDGWDIVISSLVAHHMTRGDLVAFLRFMDAEANAGWFVNDLHRHTLSWLGYPVLARLAGWHPIVRADGRTSIARAFRRDEWRDLLAEAGVNAEVKPCFPFRLCVEKRHGG